MGRHATPTSRTPRARVAPQAAPAPAGRHLLGAERAATSPTLLPSALELADRAASRIPTPELNRFVADVVAKTPPPAKRGAAPAPLLRGPGGERPPRIAIQVNDRRLISRDWAYHLENRLREAYGLEGVPLVIDFVPTAAARRGRPLPLVSEPQAP